MADKYQPTNTGSIPNSTLALDIESQIGGTCGGMSSGVRSDGEGDNSQEGGSEDETLCNVVCIGVAHSDQGDLCAIRMNVHNQPQPVPFQRPARPAHSISPAPEPLLVPSFLAFNMIDVQWSSCISCS